MSKERFSADGAFWLVVGHCIPRKERSPKQGQKVPCRSSPYRPQPPCAIGRQGLTIRIHCVDRLPTHRDHLPVSPKFRDYRPAQKPQGRPHLFRDFGVRKTGMDVLKVSSESPRAQDSQPCYKENRECGANPSKTHWKDSWWPWFLWMISFLFFKVLFLVHGWWWRDAQVEVRGQLMGVTSFFSIPWGLVIELRSAGSAAGSFVPHPAVFVFVFVYLFAQFSQYGKLNPGLHVFKKSTLPTEPYL